ncbi:MFS transporter [Streptomyces lydicus]|nr:MFS transporter [Streptomyces lydicus]
MAPRSSASGSSATPHPPTCRPPWPKFGQRPQMGGATLLSVSAFGLLPYARAGWLLCGLLVLAGLGVSVHFLLSRVLIAETMRDRICRNRLFSLLQVAVNAAAALGPFITNALYMQSDPRRLMWVVALCYTLAALALLPGLPWSARPTRTSGTWPVSRRVLRQVLTTPRVRRVILVSVLGTFVYAQFYSAFALYVGKEFDSAVLRSVLVAGPALWIVVLQTGVAAGGNRLMRGGATPFAVLGCANLLFGASMVTLGIRPAVGAMVAILVFSVAEMMFGPMMSTASAALPTDSSPEAFNLRQVC